MKSGKIINSRRLGKNMPIKVLSPDVISKIAAGEVIERPASVVKELLDNSIDANATQIMVDIGGRGVELIRVVDNGDGISAGDVDLVFERHSDCILF